MVRIGKVLRMHHREKKSVGDRRRATSPVKEHGAGT